MYREGIKLALELGDLRASAFRDIIFIDNAKSHL